MTVQDNSRGPSWLLGNKSPMRLVVFQHLNPPCPWTIRNALTFVSSRGFLRHAMKEHVRFKEMALHIIGEASSHGQIQAWNASHIVNNLDHDRKRQ